MPYSYESTTAGVYCLVDFSRVIEDRFSNPRMSVREQLDKATMAMLDAGVLLVSPCTVEITRPS